MPCHIALAGVSTAVLISPLAARLMKRSSVAQRPRVQQPQLREAEADF